MLKPADRKTAARLVLQIDDALAALRDFFEQVREEWDDRTEKWQEGEKGAAALEEIEAFEDGIDTISQEIDTFREHIGEAVFDKVIERVALERTNELKLAGRAIENLVKDAKADHAGSRLLLGDAFVDAALAGEFDRKGGK